MEFETQWLIPLGIIAAYLILSYYRRTSKNPYPYISQQLIFSAAERSFFGVLTQAVGEDAVILAKVRIADVIKPIKGLNRSEWQIAFNRISAKHFDYVLCTADTLSVIAVVELDDRSHSQKKRIARDKFVDGACLAAGIRLHRVKVQASYNLASIKEMIFLPVPVIEPEFAPLNEINGVSIIMPAEDHAQAAKCPKCSSELVTRVAKKGKQKGTKFLGCSAFPKCRYSQMPEAD